MRASLKVKHQRKACLPATPMSAIKVKASPSAGPKQADVKHQCEPTEAMQTRMQYNWAAYDLPKIEPQR